MDHDAQRANHRMTIAIALSVALHCMLGITWFASHVAGVRTPTHEQNHDLAALSDAITITERNVPRVVTAQPRRVAARPSRPAPLARPPQPQPVTHPRPVAIAHVPRPTVRVRYHQPAPAPTPRTVAAKVAQTRPQPRGVTRSQVLEAAQLAAMRSQFQREIAADKPVLSSVATPPPVASARTRRDLVMAGTRDAVLGGQGVCVSLRDWIDGDTRWHFIECRTVYADGFEETVAFPWPMSWPVNADPIDHPGQTFHPQPPPSNFALPAVFTPSRAVCSFFRERCAALFDEESPPGPA